MCCPIFAHKKHAVILRTTIITIFLILVFACQSFRKLVIFAAFNANQNYVAKELCVNRARPWMHCNGHCILSKRMAEEDRQQNARHASQKTFPQMSEYFYQSQPSIPFSYIMKERPSLNGHYVGYPLHSYSSGLLRPPSLRA